MMPALEALRTSHQCSRLTFPQCALGATTQKYTSLLATPGIAPKLAHLSALRCTHATHVRQRGGVKSPDGSWTSSSTAAYPPDMNYHIAKAIAGLRPKLDAFPQSHSDEPTRTLPIPVAVATPIDAASDA
eukprot:3498316-Pleurochrysis_carterae.AAC.1